MGPIYGEWAADDNPRPREIVCRSPRCYPKNLV